MGRMVLGACLGACSCVFLLAAFGAVTGFFDGAGANHQHPPGLSAALTNTLVLAVFLGPLAATVGAFVGGCVGLGMDVAADGGRDTPY